ncbi:hypothetical protein HYW94_03760 [Candidatus Uhrbacteria bacterium]|nr:hypothetical protein [Candidatus Uhrbacteria bacterium]
MKNIISKIYFFLLSLFVFLIPLQTVYIFRQGPIGHEGAGREGIWQFGTLAFYATDILFLLIFIFVCVRFFVSIRTQERRHLSSAEVLSWLQRPVVIFLICLFFIALVSVLWSPDKILAVQAVFRLFEGGVIFLLISHISSVKQKMCVWIFILSAVIQSVFGAIQFFMQEIPAVSWLGIAHHASWIPGDAVVESTERRWLRAYGSFPHPNILAAYLVAGYFFCIAVIMRSEKKIWTWLATLAGVSILFGLMLTFSREAWIGLGIGLAMMGVVSAYKNRVRHSHENGNPGERSILQKTGSQIGPVLDCDRGSGMTMIKTIRISPLIFFFLVSLITILFSGMLFSEPLSVRLGVDGWKRLEIKSIQERLGSVKEFVSLGPILVRGVGIGQYTNTLHQRDVKNNAVRPSYAYQPVHTVFLLVFAELGIAGISAFISFLFFLVWRVCHSARNDTLIGFGLLSSFIIISFFDHFFWTIHSGILLWWVCIAGLDKKKDIV